MTRTLAQSFLILISLALATPAFSAAYLKVGDIKGESTDASHTPRTQSLQTDTGARPTGLLVPAVQNARKSLRPAPKSADRGGHIES